MYCSVMQLRELCVIIIIEDWQLLENGPVMFGGFYLQKVFGARRRITENIYLT